MIYNVFDSKAPKMPKFGRGTEVCKLLVSKASSDMQEVLLPMSIPALAAHLTNVKFMYSDGKYYELAGQMGHLIGPSGIGKAQLNHLLETILRSFREHDQKEFEKLFNWQRLMKTHAKNSKIPERPDVSFWFPPADLTNAAFLQNSMALENNGGHIQYLNLPEVEMCDRICGGHRQVSQMLRNVYDCGRAGALRARPEEFLSPTRLVANVLERFLAKATTMTSLWLSLTNTYCACKTARVSLRYGN